MHEALGQNTSVLERDIEQLNTAKTEWDAERASLSAQVQTLSDAKGTLSTTLAVAEAQQEEKQSTQYSYSPSRGIEQTQSTGAAGGTKQAAALAKAKEYAASLGRECEDLKAQLDKLDGLRDKKEALTAKNSQLQTQLKNKPNSPKRSWPCWKRPSRI